MDDRKKKLYKRIGALILLVLFVLLIVNITVFQFYSEISMGIYVLILVYFLFFNKSKKEQNEDEITKKENTTDE